MILTREVFHADTRPPPKLARALMIAALIPIVLSTLGVWLQLQYQQTSENRTRVAASLGTILAAKSILVDIKDAARSHRGYALTGDVAILAPYYRTSRSIAREVSAFALMPGNDVSDIRFKITMLRHLVAHKMSKMQAVITVRDRDGISAAVLAVEAGDRARLIEKIDIVVGDIIERQYSEIRKFENRSLRLEKRAVVGYWTIAGTFSLGALLFSYFFWKVRFGRYGAIIAAREALTRQAALFDHTLNPVIAIDAFGRIEMANRAAEQLFGHSADHLIGSDIALIADIAPGRGTFLDRIGYADHRIAEPTRSHMTGICRDGSKVSLDVSLGAMPLADGVHIVAAFRDTSERDRVERMKDQFISNVSHELRTPLTSIVGSLGLIRAGASGELPEAAMQLVSLAQNNATRLIRIVNDLLDIEKMLSGEMSFLFGRHDLGEIARKACDGMLGFAQPSRARLIAPSMPTPTMIWADEERLIQAITNLLSNAIKFSPADCSVMMSIHVEGAEVILSVQDQGPGIGAELRDRLFSRFAQGEHQTMSATAGTGLGLAITREIIRAHKGRIWLDDADGGGCLFRFALPLMASN